ncbi:hypothetical protein Poli38472_010666 [Pythium oligandrum]|uniref:Katanin p60 ATPase-containing subunit A1 n=1 Tax=Pythium oligandrum TaxID=41045 RepID=A0A8K1FCF8_PYTOL|nr:hypothetical protein Poli38472_010666 [Pythium oligandrum]|eukprot:TMW55784.1 hypothetical protein Poli38472_010666 [Pythium oligandrum]
MKHRLLRARELCLLGDYDVGVPEFRRVMQEIQRESAFASPQVRQFLQDLQEEYATLVQYEKTLHDLKAASERVQGQIKLQRRKVRASWDSSPSEPMDIDQRGSSRSRPNSLSPQFVKAQEKRLPPWAKTTAKQPDPPRNRPVTRSATARRVPVTSSQPRKSIRDRGKENNSKNVPARSSHPPMKSTAELALTRRLNRGSTGSGKRSSLDPPAKIPNSEENDTIAGKQKYSDIAKEAGWADQELIESIEREIVDQGERITFPDIAGLEHTKQLLQEAVMLPQIAPHLFKDGLLKHCSGILMFGPPGTGKTLLAKAVANECGLTFFNVSASTLSSKYRGDSEKLVRILFDMARYYSPSIIFMDEIDAIASARGAANEHEASRRVKTELLVQISGVPSGEAENAHVMLLAATNLPWELDEAMRRRLTKRVYIPLPGEEARRALFNINLKKVELAPDVDIEDLVANTDGYSGDDITNVCETAKRMPVKRLYTPDLLSQLSRRVMEQGADHSMRDLEQERLIVTKDDFTEALQNVSKSVGHDQLVRFQEWENEFGSK